MEKRKIRAHETATEKMMRRARYNYDSHTLALTSPHDCIPSWRPMLVAKLFTCIAIQKDVPVSLWKFARYWKARLEWPHRVLLLRYEDLQTEPIVHVKTLAEFMGQPFSLEDDQEGVVHKMIKLCSFENLSNLEVNKIGTPAASPTCVRANDVYFRRVRLEIGRII
ncbi:Flavonol 4'-sulfotransferase [Vitis vinifera]|uniref:Sulfotransferase n=1 Tax=Vitis vinifera TaxID=29760 RepID=A0A438H551_VITVI|nr:Flavonol 4'-sulfotransferase [Vitis vinifera]